MSKLEEKFDKAEDIILKRSFRSKSGFDDLAIYLIMIRLRSYMSGIGLSSL